MIEKIKSILHLPPPLLSRSFQRKFNSQDDWKNETNINSTADHSTQLISNKSVAVCDVLFSNNNDKNVRTSCT